MDRHLKLYLSQVRLLTEEYPVIFRGRCHQIYYGENRTNKREYRRSVQQPPKIASTLSVCTKLRLQNFTSLLFDSTTESSHHHFRIVILSLAFFFFYFNTVAGHQSQVFQGKPKKIQIYVDLIMPPISKLLLGST